MNEERASNMRKIGLTINQIIEMDFLMSLLVTSEDRMTAVRKLFEGFTDRSGVAKAVLAYLAWLAERSLEGVIDVHGSPGFINIWAKPAKASFLPVLEGMMRDCLEQAGVGGVEFQQKKPSILQIPVRQKDITSEDLDFIMILAHEMKVAAGEGVTLIDEVEDLEGIVEWKNSPETRAR